MNRLQRANRVRHIGVGLALSAALALVNGCASEPYGDVPSDEATDAMVPADREMRYACRVVGTIPGTLRVFYAAGTTHPTCSVANVELPDSRRDYCTGIGSVSPICPICKDLREDIKCFLNQTP